MNTLRLNLGKYLEQHSITSYNLIKESGLASNTIYALARKPAQRIDLDTVSTILNTLERITGKEVSITDVLENTSETRATKRPGDPIGYLALIGLFNRADDPDDINPSYDSNLTQDEILDLAINEEYLEQLGQLEQ